MLDEFTDSEDEKAVEDILSQAFDHSVLEQIAAINCSSFSNSDHLPSHLENRLRKLKSLPTSTVTSDGRFPHAKSKSFTPRSGHDSVHFEKVPDLKTKSEKLSPEIDSDGKHGNKVATTKSGVDSVNPSSPDSEDFRCRSSEESSDENEEKVRKSNRSKYGTGLHKSRSSSWIESLPSSESESGSPVRRSIGCLWCTPKKKVEKKKKQRKERYFGDDLANENDVDLMKLFSEKEQKKIMKKAMREEEKINKEAEKIVKWAKQASDRMMDVSGLVDDDQLSDFDEYTSKRK
uniref:uncharacterized protein LOC122585112 n=1 Tax=Erigeron canadensis TaxID=72917 RepID=UPI001CB9A2D0|nr:uncharacterized protein LOC122585112 [Erigeron canadensis]